MSLPTQLVAIAVLTDMLAEATTELKAQLKPQMLPGDRQTAVVYDADGKPVTVGGVTRTVIDPGGKRVAAVTDINALVRWCEVHAPDEVQTIVTVRPAFQRRLVDVVKAEGGWVTADGEIVFPDGVKLSTSDPSGGILQTTKSAAGPDLIRAEILAGRLTFADVLALPAGTP